MIHFLNLVSLRKSWSKRKFWFSSFQLQRSVLKHFSYRSTTVETLHARSLKGFGYGDVVHQF